MKFYQCGVWKKRDIFQYDNRTTVDSFLLFYLIKYLQPTRILEIGVREGWTTGIYLDSSQHSIVEGVDLNFRPMKLSNIFDSLERFTAIRETSKNIKFNHQFDFINVDGDHSYEFAYNDIEKALQHIAPNGIIMIDDIGDTDVFNACNEFILSGKLQPVFQTMQALYCIRPGENVLLAPYFIDLTEKTKDFIHWKQSKIDQYNVTAISVDPIWISYPDLFDHMLKIYDF
jgi:hypothetical protein